MIGFLGNLAIIVDLYCHYYLLKKSSDDYKTPNGFHLLHRKNYWNGKRFFIKKV